MADQFPSEKRLTSSIVIATRNRPQPLAGTLLSLNLQTRLPEEVIIVDSSDDESTEARVTGLTSSLKFPVVFERTMIRSAARQRNLGAGSAAGELIVFLDDDLDLEPDFLIELLAVFEDDREQSIGGVSGTIRNNTYSAFKGLNRLLMAVCAGWRRGGYAGKLVGPAVNFLPEDLPDLLQDVEWLPSTCVGYRREVFLRERFPEAFQGYSFGEDVHLSARVAKTHRLVNTSRARVYHYDLGKDTHKDWRLLGESMVLHRHEIMTAIMNRASLLDECRLFYFEMIYSSLAWLAAGCNGPRVRRLGEMLAGRAAGFRKIYGRGFNVKAEAVGDEAALRK
jgi:GT2 family glycosyltransferase